MRREQPFVVERVQASERAESDRAGGFDGGAEAADDGVSALDRDPCFFVSRHEG